MRTASAVLLLTALACAQTKQRVAAPSPPAIATALETTSQRVEDGSDLKMPDPITWDDSPKGPVRLATRLPVWSDEMRAQANWPAKYLFVDGQSMEADMLALDCRLIQESPQHWLKRGFTDLVVTQFDASGKVLCESVEMCFFDPQEYSEKHITAKSLSLVIRGDTAAVSVSHNYYGRVGPIPVRRPKKSSG